MSAVYNKTLNVLVGNGKTIIVSLRRYEEPANGTRRMSWKAGSDECSRWAFDMGEWSIIHETEDYEFSPEAVKEWMEIDE